MDILWFEQASADVPGSNEWLSEAELAVLGGLRIPKRREDWRLGRWTAKRAVTTALGMSHEADSLSRIVIIASATGAPQVDITGCDSPVTISITHRNGLAACAVVCEAVALGCDLELVEPKSKAFVADYLTSTEQKWLAGFSESAQPQFASLLWSAKECALKALQVGLRADTRSVEVDTACLEATSPPDTGWNHLAVSSEGGECFAGWWRCEKDIIRTVVSNPAPSRLR